MKILSKSASITFLSLFSPSLPFSFRWLFCISSFRRLLPFYLTLPLPQISYSLPTDLFTSQLGPSRFVSPSPSKPHQTRNSSVLLWIGAWNFSFPWCHHAIGPLPVSKIQLSSTLTSKIHFSLNGRDRQTNGHFDPNWQHMFRITTGRWTDSHRGKNLQTDCT
jgi:hypothetical protein